MPNLDAATAFHLGVLIRWGKEKRIGTIPDDPMLLYRMQSLDLSGQDLEKIPESITSLEHLRHLNLSENDLQTLPRNFCVLKNLKTLDLSFNRFYTLPECLFSLTHLEELNVSYNRLTDIPEHIQKLKDLKILWCVENHSLVKKQKKIEALLAPSQLQELWLDGTKKRLDSSITV